MVAELRKLDVIAVDCEGVNLSREGELCLVQIGTENKVRPRPSLLTCQPTCIS